MKVSSEGIQLNGEKTIQELDPESTYAYLSMEEGDGTDHQKMKNIIHKRKWMFLILFKLM